jgi:hypothetical protein
MSELFWIASKAFAVTFVGVLAVLMIGVAVYEKLAKR